MFSNGKRDKIARSIGEAIIRRASMEERDLATDKLCGIMPLVDKDLLRKMTDEELLYAYFIQVDGTNHYCAWANYTLDGGFHINFVVQLVDEPAGFDALNDVLTAIAAHHNCSYMRFATERAGLVQKAQALGWKIAGLNLKKQL